MFPDEQLARRPPAPNEEGSSLKACLALIGVMGAVTLAAFLLNELPFVQTFFRWLDSL